MYGKQLRQTLRNLGQFLIQPNWSLRKISVLQSVGIDRQLLENLLLLGVFMTINQRHYFISPIRVEIIISKKVIPLINS